MVARQDGPPDRAFVQPMSIPLWWYRPATSLRRPVDVVQKVGSCKGGSWPWKGIYVEMNMKRGWEEWKGDIWHFHETIVPQEIGLFCLHLPPSSIVQYALQYPKCLRLCMNAWPILADLPCWPSLLTFLAETSDLVLISRRGGEKGKGDTRRRIMTGGDGQWFLIRLSWWWWRWWWWWWLGNSLDLWIYAITLCYVFENPDFL